MKTVELYAAKVKFAAQREPLQTTNGPRINCVVIVEATGEEVKLWDDPNGLIQFLSKGEQIQLAKDAKGRWAIAGAPQDKPAAGKTTSSTPPKREDQVREVHAASQSASLSQNEREANLLHNAAKELKLLHDLVSAMFPDEPATVRAAFTTCLFKCRADAKHDH